MTNDGQGMKRQPGDCCLVKRDGRTGKTIIIIEEISLLQDFCQRSLAAQGQMDLGIRTLRLEKDKKREEVRSLKPAQNQLPQGWAQEEGAMGRKGEVLVTARGWMGSQPAGCLPIVPMRWRGFNKADNSVVEKAAWSSLSHKDLETKG